MVKFLQWRYTSYRGTVDSNSSFYHKSALWIAYHASISFRYKIRNKIDTLHQNTLFYHQTSLSAWNTEENVINHNIMSWKCIRGSEYKLVALHLVDFHLQRQVRRATSLIVYSNALCLLHIIWWAMSCKTHRGFTDTLASFLKTLWRHDINVLAL